MSQQYSPTASISPESLSDSKHQASDYTIQITAASTTSFFDYSRLIQLGSRSIDPPPYVSPYAPVSQDITTETSLIQPAGHSAPGASSAPSLPVFETRSSSIPTVDTLRAVSLNPKLYTSFYAKMNSGKMLSSKEKATLIQSLKTHRVNTLIELRRIEKALAPSKTPDVTEAMTQAWAHYVNSNNLLSELRGLTKSYPFSSECIDEAKWMVISDAQSMKSWNYCWLVLQKAKNQNLIPKHARQLAQKPAMWGGRTPTAKGVEQLAGACHAEWTQALNQALRHWDSPPTIAGRA